MDRGLSQGSGETKPEDIFTDAVKQAIKEKSYEHAALAAQTTGDRIQGLLDQAVSEGWSVPNLGKALRTQFEVDGKYRSERIARTELTATINDGTDRTLLKEGHQYKTWSTVMDGRERDTHAEADGQTVGINEMFRVGGASGAYPGDDMLPPSETIQCRCVLVAGNTPEDRRQVLNESFLRLHGSLERRLVIELRQHFESIASRVLSHFPS